MINLSRLGRQLPQATQSGLVTFSGLHAGNTQVIGEPGRTQLPMSGGCLTRMLYALRLDAR